MSLYDWPVLVTANRKVAPASYELRLAVNEAALAEQAALLEQAPAKLATFLDLMPGQFFMLSANTQNEAFLLRRPFSPLFLDKAKAELGVYYKVVGIATQHLAELPVGAALQALSPLGKPFELLAAPQNTLLVAGGVGVAPLALLAQHWPQAQHSLDRKQQNIAQNIAQHTDQQKPQAIYGVRSKGDLFGLQELTSGCSHVQVCSDDGSVGLHGNVLQALKQRQDWLMSTCQQVLVCGPNPMMAAVVAYLKQLKPTLPVHVSLENHMPCGTGACYGCVVEQANGAAPVRACLEGPTFDASRLVWPTQRSAVANDLPCEAPTLCGGSNL